MMKKIKAIVKEPLLYFFLLGAVIFGIHTLLDKNSKEGEDNRYQVEVTSSDIEWLRNRWNKLMGREPTAEELQGLIDSMIREEILYREAVAMGLDEKDTVVRRRLAQKMEFLFKDLADMTQAGEDELREYFLANKERYIVSGRVSFSHVFFSSDKRADKALSDAQAVLEEFQSQGIKTVEAVSHGDPFMLELSYEQQSLEQISRIFGGEFTEGVYALEAGAWGGPVRSSYGWHVVFVQELVESSMPSFDEVRGKVEIDFISERRSKVNEQAYNEISSRYTVLVEDLPYDLIKK
ncbi:MAG: peptidyl-prolyl cis-trans isomerase [Planctomycetota bacterium]|jgi:hypothetical protein